MFSSLAVVSLLAGAVLADTSASATSTADALVPTGISSSCTSFLTALDSNSTIKSCLTPVISASSAFGPGSNTTTSSSTVSSALSSICSSNLCSDSLLRSTLANFYSSCGTELTSNVNQDVLRLYDVMYVLSPMKTAVCSKDDNGNYCVLESSSTSTSAAASASASGGLSVNTVSVGGVDIATIQQYLYSSSSSSVTKRDAAIYPNTTTFASTNLPFIFLKSSLSYSALCTTCTRNIMTAYIDYESSAPYAPGLSSSTLLSGQTDLYNGILSTCGSSFLSGAVKAAGGLGTGSSSSSNGSYKTAGLDVQGIVAAFLGAVTMFFASFL